MVQARKLVIVAGAAAAALVVVRRGRHGARGHQVPGGILIGDAVLYDALSRLLLGPFRERIAADIAAVAPDEVRLLEVGCGPGHLSTRLAQRGFDVTGLDLDPAMIARARANTDPALNPGRRQPSFLVGDAAALAFPAGSFDLVVSTLSMHHWADPAAGLAEIGRILRPGGRALIWDLRPGARLHPFGPRHAHTPDPADHTHGSRLRVENATPWHWPWRFALTQRVQLIRDDSAGGRSSGGRCGRLTQTAVPPPWR
jgi:SAM-dependent methyltransferase